MFLLILPYAIQVLLIVHAIRNGKNTTWIWLLIMLPYVGGVIYFLMEIVPDLRRGRLDSESIVKFVDKQVTVKRLKEKLLLSDTVANQLELADEYARIGAFAEAEEIYQRQLKGLYENDRSIQLRLAEAAFHGKRYDVAAHYFGVADAAQRITASEQRTHFLYARHASQPETGLQELEAHFEISKSGVAGYYLCRALLQAGERAKVGAVLTKLGILAKNARGSARSQLRRYQKEIEALVPRGV